MVSQALSSPEHHEVCPWWKAYTFDNPIRKLFHPPRKVLGAYITEGMTVMDVGKRKRRLHFGLLDGA